MRGNFYSQMKNAILNPDLKRFKQELFCGIIMRAYLSKEKHLCIACIDQASLKLAFNIIVTQTFCSIDANSPPVVWKVPTAANCWWLHLSIKPGTTELPVVRLSTSLLYIWEVMVICCAASVIFSFPLLCCFACQLIFIAWFDLF